MGNGKRDAAELAAAVDAGIRKGLDLVDAFRGTPAGRRELEREAKRSAADTRRARRAHHVRQVQSQVMTIGGTAVSASAATAGIIDVAATGVTGAGWFAVSAIGAVIAVIGGRSWRRLSPFTAAPQITSPRRLFVVAQSGTTLSPATQRYAFKLFRSSTRLSRCTTMRRES